LAFLASCPCAFRIRRRLCTSEVGFLFRARRGRSLQPARGQAVDQEPAGFRPTRTSEEDTDPHSCVTGVMLDSCARGATSLGLRVGPGLCSNGVITGLGDADSSRRGRARNTRFRIVANALQHQFCITLPCATKPRCRRNARVPPPGQPDASPRQPRRPQRRRGPVRGRCAARPTPRRLPRGTSWLLVGRAHSIQT